MGKAPGAPARDDSTPALKSPFGRRAPRENALLPPDQKEKNETHRQHLHRPGLDRTLGRMRPDSPVLFASQPGWPFEYSIADVNVYEDSQEGTQVIYLVEGQQLGYLNGTVREAIGW